ncbi:MAG TPA: IS982 family transposase [Saprospiraceae bacterium]|nr:IS982 family transposase [Saprospiraceae bacterium]HMU05883.1 IS982 family transposase [Saprospiraceae bacterium]
MFEDKITRIFVDVDDFVKDLDIFSMKKQLLGDGVARRDRKTILTLSEMMTIYIGFHLSHHTNFKSYYKEFLSVHYKHLFPNLISYERFNQVQNRLFMPLMLYINNRCFGQCTGISYVDSTTLPVCHIKREKQHKVFKGIAQKSKSTMGWFFGFKIHLIINDKGEILSFCFSRANVDDRDTKIMSIMTKEVFGKLFGDRGYIDQKLAEYLWNDGVELIYKRRKNMKSMNLSDTDKILLRKRALIETVNDELKNICSIQHTRHRSIQGFLNNAISALIAYQSFDKKPSIKISHELNERNQLLAVA